MAFFIFFIALIVICNLGGLFRMISALLGLLVGSCVAVGLLIFIFSFFSHGSVREAHVVLPTQISSYPVLSDKNLKNEISRLRMQIQKNADASVKSLLTNHLERLESLQRQKDDEKEALRRLQEDKRALKEVNLTKRKLEKTKKSLEAELERLDSLEKSIERSRRYMDKLNETKHEKGIDR